MKTTLSYAALCGGLLFGCGGSAQGTGVGGEASVAPAAMLTIPMGSYASCRATTVTFGPGAVSVTGPWSGAVTLSSNGDGGATAVLAFQGLATVTVTFSPAGSTSAGFAGDGGAPTASSLALVEDTLLITTYDGDRATEGTSTFYACPVPSSLPTARLAINAPKTASVRTGTYGECTESLFGSDMGSGYPAGLVGSLTIGESDDGGLTATLGTGFGYSSDCVLALYDASGSTAAISDGQTCNLSWPCGPPPELGGGGFQPPSQAAVSNMTGSIDVVGGVLFLNAIGDAPSAACGSHTLAVSCAVGP